ncbi:MAG: hypothetical protein HZA32_10435 [Opitutae bacterium]|nr:hypothetical protein [Opitutae bacterium]
MNRDIHISGEGNPTPVSVPAKATPAELLVAAQQAGIISADAKVEEVLLFAADEDEPLTPERFKEPAKERLRIHCHRCRKIEVTVVFNLKRATKAFAPSVGVRRVLKWALKEFGLTGADAENKELRLGDASGQSMSEEAAIGSYARFPKCEVTAYLADICQVQG